MEQYTIKQLKSENTYITVDGYELISTLPLSVGDNVTAAFLGDRLHTYFPEETTPKKIDPLNFKTERQNGKYIGVRCLIDLRPPTESFFRQPLKFTNEYTLVPTKLGNEYGYCGIPTEVYENLINEGCKLFLTDVGATAQKVLNNFKEGKKRKYQPLFKDYLVMWYRGENNESISGSELIERPSELVEFCEDKISAELSNFLSSYQEEWDNRANELYSLTKCCGYFTDNPLTGTLASLTVDILDRLKVSQLDYALLDNSIIQGQLMTNTNLTPTDAAKEFALLKSMLELLINHNF